MSQLPVLYQLGTRWVAPLSQAKGNSGSIRVTCARPTPFCRPPLVPFECLPKRTVQCPLHFCRGYSGDKFVVSSAGEAYDAREISPNRKFQIGNESGVQCRYGKPKRKFSSMLGVWRQKATSTRCVLDV